MLVPHRPFTRATAVAARDFVVPIGMAVLVGLFLGLQAWIGRRDPKLTIAPVGAHDEYLTFS